MFACSDFGLNSARRGLDVKFGKIFTYEYFVVSFIMNKEEQSRNCNTIANTLDGLTISANIDPINVVPPKV